MKFFKEHRGFVIFLGCACLVAMGIYSYFTWEHIQMNNRDVSSVAQP